MKVVLHIGLPKTGSTSIQATLAQKRRDLARAGIFYPRLAGFHHHNLLALPFGKRKLPRAFQLQLASYEQARELAERAWKTVAAETARKKPKTVVLSGEYFWKVQRHRALRQQLSEAFPQATNIEIVAYLRRPSRHYVSMLQQLLHASHTIPAPVRLEYAKVLRRWAKTGNLVLREYAPRHLLNGDIVDDFYVHFLGQPSGPRPRIATEKNVSLSPESMVVLQRVRRHLHPKDNHIITRNSDRLVAALRDAERRVGVRQTPLRLRPRFANHLDQPHADDRRLERSFGFRFVHLKDSAKKGPIVELPRPTEVEQVVGVDEERLAQIYSATLEVLLETPAKGSVSERLREMWRVAKRRWPRLFAR